MNLETIVEELLKIQNQAGIDKNKFMSMLGVTDDNLALEEVLIKPHVLKLRNVLQFCQYLGVTLEQTSAGEYDLNTIKKKIGGDTCYINPKYSETALSKTISINIVFDYIAKFSPHYSSVIRNHFTEHFQISGEYLNNPVNSINFKLITDSVDFFKQNNINNYYEVGKHAHSVISKQPAIQEKLKGLRADNHKKLYENFFNEYVSIFETNFEYKISKLSKNYLYVDAAPTESLVELLKDKYPYNASVSEYRLGFFTNIVNYSSLNATKVTEIKSPMTGNKYCRYEIAI